MDFLGSNEIHQQVKKKWRHLGQWDESLNTALARRVWCNACERKIVVVPLKLFRFWGEMGKGREGIGHLLGLNFSAFWSEEIFFGKIDRWNGERRA